MKIKQITLTIFCYAIVTGCGGGETGNDAASCNIIGLNPKVINGTTCVNTQNSSVVRLGKFSSSGELESIFCTGTLIAPRTILTATHCSGVFGDGFVAVLSGDPGAVKTSMVVAASAAPGFTLGTDNRLFNDAMVLRIADDLNIPAMPVLLSRSVSNGEPGYVFGYGRTVVGDAADPDQGIELQGGTMEIREVTPNHIFVSFDGNVNVCNGDSGGPLVVSVNGQPAVAGITSSGSIPGCKEGDVTTFTNLQSPTVLPWLASVAPTAFVRSQEID